MRPRLQAAIALFASALALSACGLVKGVAAFYGLPVAQQTPAQLDEALRPHDLWFVPTSTEGGLMRYPGVLLVPGCAGTQPFHLTWAERFRAAGHVVLVPDSFKARGILAAEALEGACEGEHTWGFERAGDVLLSLRALRAHPQVNADALHLVGWSHGGWAVMDAVALAGAGETPPLLTEPVEAPLDGVRSAAVLYPYCDFGTFTPRLGWPTSVPGLVILAGRDRNIEPEPCMDVVSEQAARNRPLRQRVLDVDHWFDNPEGTDIVAHEHDVAATTLTWNLLRSLQRGEVLL